MKKTLFVCLMTFTMTSFGQNRNNVWMLCGYGIHNCGIQFISGQVDTFSVYRNMEFFITNASICDTTGELLFYTNGDYIENRNHSRLLNSTNFNPTVTGDTIYGSNVPQGTLVLPYPSHPDWYYVFHVNGESFNAHGLNNYEPLELRYSVVDMNLAGGLGGIIANKKNISIINDTLTLGRITACKHANGRDWWVVVHRANSDQYYKMLITPDTILTSSQSIGGVIRGGLSDVAGQALFSPDGAKYALLTYDTTMYVMDFDRCTGDFSNGVMVTIPDTNLATVGCAFSPNSRFLYVSNNQHVFQFDTWAGASMPSTKTIVATYDGFISGLHSTFFMMQLAPDNKIYISTSQGTNVLHVINDPDQPGLSCNLVQHQLRLPSYNAEALPNAPNYDLGALTGSVCDSLPHVGIIELADQQDLISVFPNPSVTGIFYFQLNESPDQIKNMEILDVTGRLIDASKKNLYEVDISSSAGGIYFYSIQTKSGKIIKGKLVKE